MQKSDQEIELESARRRPLLTTPLGRFIDKASYVDLALAGTSCLLLTSLSLYFMPDGNSISHSQKNDITFWDCLYFTTVTFTSLGYGDFTPQGWGRVLAVANVFSGLAFFAIVIGKASSERTQATLTLLHRSDVLRRLIEFHNEMEQNLQLLREALKNNETTLLSNYIQEAETLRLKVASYVIFHTYQSTALIHGNDSAVKMLMEKNLEVTETMRCIYIHAAAQRNVKLGIAADIIVNQTPKPYVILLNAKTSADPSEPYSNRLYRKIRSLLSSGSFYLFTSRNLDRLKASIITRKFKKSLDLSIFIGRTATKLRHKGLKRAQISERGAAKSFSGWRRVIHKMNSVNIEHKAWKNKNIDLALYGKVLEVAPTGAIDIMDNDLRATIQKKLKISRNHASKYIEIISTDRLC